MKDITQMSLKEKIGQLIIVGFPSLTYDQHIKYLVDEYACGNVILFSRNFESANQLKNLNQALYENIQKRTGLIPFIAIDQEGGMVTRLTKDVVFPPSQMTSSASSFDDAPYYCGKIIGEDMISLGLNFNLAPCLEVNNNLENYTVNVRSYGSNPNIVSHYAHEFINGLSEYGVLACCKHFPGEGKSLIDTHLELPILDEPLEEIEKNGLAPFINNIDTSAIMTTHTIFKAYDRMPATLSYKVITGLLRHQMGYKGMVISDCLEMKAIQDHFTTPNGAVLALKAGCDAVLCCHTLELQIECFNKVYDAVAKGFITIDEIDEKVKRIINYKEKIKPYLDKYFNMLSYVKNMQNEELAERIVDLSLTKILGTLPSIDSNTLLIAPKLQVSSIVEDEFDERSLASSLKKNFENKIIELDDDLSLNQDLSLFSQIIIFSYDACKNELQKRLINNILEKYQNVYVIALKGPMDKMVLNNLVNFSCMYEYTKHSIASIIKFLKNELTALGRLPDYEI